MIHSAQLRSKLSTDIIDLIVYIENHRSGNRQDPQTEIMLIFWGFTLENYYFLLVFFRPTNASEGSPCPSEWSSTIHQETMVFMEQSQLSIPLKLVAI